jgi:hypothetical protein
MMTIYLMYQHFRRQGKCRGRALARALHVYRYGF